MNILITGGASGLGRAITKKALEDKSNKVYFTYSNSLQKARELESSYANAVAIHCDFRNEVQVQELSKTISELDIDALINNAYTGEFLKSHFQKAAPQDFLDSFQQNLLPTILVTQAAIKVFRAKKHGKIVTVLTAALANTPPIGSSIYSANKAYLSQLTKAWATENAKFNITSNSVSPGFMITGLTDSLDQRLIEQIIDSHPFKKLLTPEEVSDTVCYLLNSSPQINGVDILLNGGANIR